MPCGSETTRTAHSSLQPPPRHHRKLSGTQGGLLGLLLGVFLFAGQRDLEIVRVGQVDVATRRELGCKEVGQAEIVRRKPVPKVEDLSILPARLELDTGNVLEHVDTIRRNAYE